MNKNYKLNGKKNLNCMIHRAEQEHMMFIDPVFLSNMSKQYSGIEYCNPLADHDSYAAEFCGSPADIRKAIRYVEQERGITPFYETAPIMRENRSYSLYVEDGYWTVSRIYTMDDFAFRGTYDEEVIL